MSPPRRRKEEGRGKPQAVPDLDELRARLAETLHASERRPPAGRKRRPVPPDEGADEVVPDDSATGPWWRDEDAGRPRPVVGGIAARTRKGPIGASWWSRRFLDSVEAVMVGGRMERGRSYARKGQVVDLHVGPGVVSATVQGSREDPYVVRLRMPVVTGEDWDRILRALAARAGYAARMLAGELPHEVETVFSAEGASLLPAPDARLVTECTCPDWENPCKHIAAVCYLVAEELDRDPFALFAWRGKGRGEALGELRALRRSGAGPVPLSGGGVESGAETSPGEGGIGCAEAGAGDWAGAAAAAAAAAGTGAGAGPVQRFWVAGPELAHLRIRPEEARMPAAVLRLAPRGTIVVRGGDLADVLVPVYRRLAASAAVRARR